MKQFLTLLVTCFFYAVPDAQPLLEITTNKTISLVFPFPILQVDRGANDIIVQPVKGSANILFVKASHKEFLETNLSVVTDDGSVYAFRVNYNPDPAIWIYYLPANNKVTIATYANGVLDNPLTVKGIHDRHYNIIGKIAGIYIKNDVIYYQLQLHNLSPIDYDIGLLRFYIRDKRKGKRTAVQENEMKPLYVAGNTTQVKANSRNNIVIALEKFTIPDAKYLAVQVMEKNGGRHIMMKLRNSRIFMATPLPDWR
ncbi:MAG: conjugative transposon protein TraN [Chitinophagaceae bacterium]